MPKTNPTPHGPRGPRGMNTGAKIDANVLKRVMKLLFSSFPVLMPVTIVCIIFSSITAAVPAVFQQQVIADIEKFYLSGDWSAAAKVIIPKIAILITFYALSLASITLYTQLMAFITQGFLNKMRLKMFDKMQDLPVKYFDTHKHGEIMSYYTNDIDTLRELISRALPTLLQASIVVISVFSIMVYYSMPMTAVVILGVFAMFFVSKKVGGGSAKYFMRQQKSVARTEGFVQEMMNGQKVIKVFSHEEKCKEGFAAVNEELYGDSFRAHAYANCLGPIIQNIGNVLYVIIATVGGVLLLSKVPNLGISTVIAGGFGILTIDIVVPFLNMSK